MSGARQASSAFFRVALMPVCFLLPAGTWRWPEAWAVTALYAGFGLSSWIFLRRNDPELLAERLKPDQEQSQQAGWDRALLGVMVLAGLGMVVLPGVDAIRFGWSRIPLWLEAAAMVAHLPLFAAVLRVYKENTWTSRVVKVDRERGQQVVTTGPYALVRHPMYAAVIPMLLLFPVALGSWWTLVPSGLMVGLLVLRTAKEDRTLHRELEGYAEYARVTRYRLVPGVW